MQNLASRIRKVGFIQNCWIASSNRASKYFDESSLVSTIQESNSETRKKCSLEKDSQIIRLYYNYSFLLNFISMFVLLRLFCMRLQSASCPKFLAKPNWGFSCKHRISHRQLTENIKNITLKIKRKISHTSQSATWIQRTSYLRIVHSWYT